MVQGRKSKNSVSTVNLFHDGIFICNPLKYAEGDVKQINNVNFDGMDFSDLRYIVVLEHNDYNVLDFLLEETSDPELISASSDEYYSDDESEDIDGMRFDHPEQLKICLANYGVGYQLWYAKNDRKSILVFYGRNVDKYRSEGCYAKMKKDVTRNRKQRKGCSNIGGFANNGEVCSKDVGGSVNDGQGCSNVGGSATPKVSFSMAWVGLLYLGKDDSAAAEVTEEITLMVLDLSKVANSLYSLRDKDLFMSKDPQVGNSQQALKDKGVIDSGCSRH
nr:zinc finger, PMZ-type [Tanacetum cinerariifolium]